MNLDDALKWASSRHHCVLITLRSDGRPQSSDVAFLVENGDFLISVTADRAKTRNIERDPRVVVHLTDAAHWTYLSFDGTGALSPVTTSPDDETSEALVHYYRAVAGKEHPDWAEYRQAMIDESRQILRVTPTHVVGQINT